MYLARPFAAVAMASLLSVPLLAQRGFDEGGVSAEERKALISLYEATSGSSWKRDDGWLGAPGTECKWHGVSCGPYHVSPQQRGDKPWSVVGLDLAYNDLAGRIPQELGGLREIARLSLFSNKLTGRVPEALVRKWLDGKLELAVEVQHLTDVSEVSFTYDASALLCARYILTFHADGTVSRKEQLCRKASPDDRETYCEIRNGEIHGEFARLGWLLVDGGFFNLEPEYWRNTSDLSFHITRAVRGGRAHQVSNYGSAGPFRLWAMEAAIMGIASMADWKETKRQPSCSEFEQAQPEDQGEQKSVPPPQV